jgi:hypothetical protein
MNPNSLNEYATRLHSISGLMPEGFNKLPLFYVGFVDSGYVFPQDDKKEFIFHEDRVKIPFKEVRVIDVNKNEDDTNSGYVFSVGNKLVSITNFTECPSIKRVISFSCLMKHEDLAIASRSPYYSVEKLSLTATIYPKVERIKDSLIGDELLNKSSLQCLARLFEFSGIVNCPRHFITLVRPSNNNKRSVEWVQKRSHYIVLGPEHQKSIISGDRKPLNGNITRSMHNRRAHFRTLTSDKFKKKKGLRIWVKAAWVGPKEWKDSVGSTYIIQDKII